MQLNLLVLSYVASAAVSLTVALFAWRRRRLVGALGLALLMLAVSWWLLANALEAAALDRSGKIVWSVVAYPGIELVPVLYVSFVLTWTRQDRRLRRPIVALLMVIPVVSVGLAATNEWHHLLWSSVTLIDAWGVTAVYEHGPWFLVEAGYAYSLVGLGLAILVIAIYRYADVYSARIRVVIAGSLVPVAASVLYVAGFDATVHADLSSISFAAAGVVAAWAVLRSRLLEFVPVAWPTLVESMADGVLVLDPERRVAAFNPSAGRLLGMRADAVGREMDLVFDQIPDLVVICRRRADDEAEIALATGRPAASSSTPQASEETRWLNVRTTHIVDGRGRDAGCLVVLRDVTERRQMVETIRTLSLTDELTGLLNRRGFTTLAQQQIRTAVRTRHRLWLLFADIDGLKDINDRLGHEAGDRALCETATVLRTASRRGADLVARMGGDEFAILVTEVSSTDGATVLKRVRQALQAANELPDREFTLSVSVGAAVFTPARPRTLDELLAKADRRMYQTRNSRRT